MKGLNDILQDMIDYNTFGHAIICLSLGGMSLPSMISGIDFADVAPIVNSKSDDPANEPELEKFKALLSVMIKKGVIVVVAAGNDADKGYPEVDKYPALWGLELPIIVVGSVDQNGQRSDFSQYGPVVGAYAGGSGIECPAKEGKGMKVVESGTSFAAPSIAGLAANLLSNSMYTKRLAKGGRKSLSQNMKDLIQSLAWSRVDGGPEVAWNGVNWTTEYTQGCQISSARIKRDGSCGKLMLKSRFLCAAIDSYQTFLILLVPILQPATTSTLRQCQFPHYHLPVLQVPLQQSISLPSHFRRL